MDTLNPFLAKHKEKADMNQYWYSKATINFMAAECEQFGKKIAFLSTPSIYFSLKNKEIRGTSKVFDVRKFQINVNSSIKSSIRTRDMYSMILINQRNCLQICTELSTW
jgi:hypothetical protein